MPERWRLFVAAPLPGEAAARAWDALAEVRAAHPGVRWLSPEKLHLTLVFLGPTEPSRAATLMEALHGAVTGRAPYGVTTGAAGGRVDDRRGGVLWLRVAQGADETARLSLDVDRALGVGSYGAGRQPRPHLTVARGADTTAADALRAAASGVSLGWTVGRVALLRSHTERSGSRYEQLASFDLSP